MTDIRLFIDRADNADRVRIEAGTGCLVVDEPIQAVAFGHDPVVSQYASIVGEDDRLIGTGRVQLGEGTTVEVRDTFRSSSTQGVRLSRNVSVVEVGSAPGVRVGLSASADDPAADERTWQFFLPGTLYNRNDSDEDGVEDYLGTYVQDLRDDKNGALAAMARCPGSGMTFSIARCTPPSHDTALTEDQLRARHFVQNTDIGSLGLAPRDRQVRLRASYPFCEEYSFSLDMAGTGWSAYAPNRLGRLATIEYEFRVSQTADLTEGIWELHSRQREVLRTRRPEPALTLADSLEFRQLLTQLYYRTWDTEENEKEPAGYLVHFSPRDGKTRGSLIEFGFSGDQTLLAFTQLRWGHLNSTPLYRQRARAVIDFFIERCRLPNGMSRGIYDPLHDRFVDWFTGILMPFQYAQDEEDTRRFVGSQMTDALLPIARDLRALSGNYLRTMCESFYPVLLAYELDLREGERHEAWRDAAEQFGRFLLASQAEDGSWNRAYDLEGEPLTEPHAWFGASYREQKSGTIFPIPVLTTLHRITGDPTYIAAARRAGDYILENFVATTTYVGGLNDTTHVKSVKTDSVGVMFLMRSLLKVYESTKDPRYLDGAVKAAKILSSFVYLWDVPMPEESLLGTSGFKSTGWAVCDVIASGSYLDNEFLEFTGDLVRVADYAGHEGLFDIAELVEFGMQYAVSTPWNDLGYVAPGIQTEGILTSYWLSTPDRTEFSGAVNKVKGDDNDTANALTNGQAAYGVYDLLDAYGTDDFEQIRQRIFGSRREPESLGSTGDGAARMPTAAR